MIDSDRISGITFSASISILSSKGSRFNLFLYESEALLNTSDLIWKFTDQHHYHTKNGGDELIFGGFFD